MISGFYAKIVRNLIALFSAYYIGFFSAVFFLWSTAIDKQNEQKPTTVCWFSLDCE